MAPIERTKRINLHATEAEQDMLRRLAEREGLSMSDYLRQHIRRAHAEAFGHNDVDDLRNSNEVFHPTELQRARIAAIVGRRTKKAKR